MAIDGSLRGKLEPGTKLIAKYRGQEHIAEVVAGEDGKVRYRLEDGNEYKSPSAAASAVMSGQAANGWRWWSLQGDTPATDAKPATVKARKARKPKAAVEPVEAPESEPVAEETATE